MLLLSNVPSLLKRAEWEEIHHAMRMVKTLTLVVRYLRSCKKCLKYVIPRQSERPSLLRSSKKMYR